LNWFYHAPGEGRIGPLSADELRRRYKERRIQRDTLVWREGLPEWQPLERVADEVDLFSVTPDASLPPPLPAAMPMAVAPAMAGVPARGPGHLQPERKRMNGCLIALIVVAALAIPTLGILAAIALPAYNDYVGRSKVAAYVEPRAAALRLGTERARSILGRCPEEPLEAGLEGDAAQGVRTGILDDGRCAFEITVMGVDPKVDGKTVLHVAPASAGGDWDCTGGDLPRIYRSAACRGTEPDTATP
jgi:type IV pilus assembly protein PilA